MMPICFQVVPDPGREQQEGERDDLRIGQALRDAVLVGDLGLDQHADQVVATLGPARLDDRLDDAEELADPDTVGGDRGADGQRLGDGDAEAPGDGEERDGREELDVEVGATRALQPGHECIDGPLDPLLLPPRGALRQERRLHQRAVPAVPGAVHEQDAGVDHVVADRVAGHERLAVLQKVYVT